MSQLIIDLVGQQLTPQEENYLKEPSVAGVILFTRNYTCLSQLKKLTESIKNIRQDLLICTDQEGGRVQRFKTDFTRLPSLKTLGNLHSRNQQQAKDMIYKVGWLMAYELIQAGVDLSFSPVVDINYHTSQVIGDRAFATDADIISNLATYYIEGMHDAGMANSIKHFPGHGYVQADSHHELPLDDRDFIQILKSDLKPFQKLIATGKISSVMAAHILYPQIDSKPSGFSRYWLDEILRKQLGFQGVIFSDDLSMHGAHWAGNIQQRIDMASQAGCDLLLLCNSPQSIAQSIQHIEKKCFNKIDYASLLMRNSNHREIQSDKNYKEIKLEVEKLTHAVE